MAIRSDSGLAFVTEQAPVRRWVTVREGKFTFRAVALAAMSFGLLLAHAGLELLVDFIKRQARGALIRRLEQKQQDRGTDQNENDIEDDCLWFQSHMTHAGYLQGR